MTELKRLRVSLTKHGAHKVYRLVQHFPAKKVLQNTWDKWEGIRIDRAQAAKNLSALPDDTLPAIWAEAKKRSSNTLKHLVFLGIVFSHHKLIEAFSQGAATPRNGRLVKGKVVDGKAFTNIKNDLEELGLATSTNPNFVDYDLSDVLGNPLLPDLAATLLHIKLTEAGWLGVGPLAGECARLGLHRVLALSEAEFRRWLAGASPLVPEEDELPEIKDEDQAKAFPFHFSAGHRPRLTGSVVTGRRKVTSSVRLLHNEMQSVLFEILEASHGPTNVGTELDAGSPATSIDLVVRSGAQFDFYEIKTSVSLKKCLRQAISQLLEYAYWPDTPRAHRLIVVSQAAVTKDATRYLDYLRKSLSIPIYYRQLDLGSKTLSPLH